MEIFLSKKEYDRVLKAKNDIHKRPEVSFEEFNTTKIIRDYLKKYPNIKEIKLGLKTGLVAKLESPYKGKDKKCIGLRADIDAISQIEDKSHKVKSSVNGLMHGCGHDFHTASLLGAAGILSKNIKDIKNDIVFIFQPAEETTMGAKYLIDKGLFDKVKMDAIFGIHNRPEIESGKVVVKSGELMSNKCNFNVTIIGKGGHGSNPHECIDPIVCVADIINSYQTIVSRTISPLDSAVLSINYINGGNPDNLVFDTTFIKATLRALNNDTYKKALKIIKDMTQSIAKAYRCKAIIEIEEEVPSVFNKNNMYNKAYKNASMIVGTNNIVSEGLSLASEDFSFYSKYVPTFFYWVGSGFKNKKSHPWHDSKFITNDEALKVASSIYAISAINY